MNRRETLTQLSALAQEIAGYYVFCNTPAEALIWWNDTSRLLHDYPWFNAADYDLLSSLVEVYWCYWTELDIIRGSVCPHCGEKIALQRAG